MILFDMAYPLSDSMINYAQPLDHSRVVCALVRPGLLSRCPMALVATNPAQLPRTLSIGTRRVFNEGSEYHYRFVDGINMYVCDHQTTTKVDGEVMAIQVGVDDQGQNWYVAQEGQLVDDQFVSRQFVFRTIGRFWEAGKHEWQLNPNSSATNRDNSTWGDSMFAFTQVPEDVEFVPAAVGLQRIPDF